MTTYIGEELSSELCSVIHSKAGFHFQAKSFKFLSKFRVRKKKKTTKSKVTNHQNQQNQLTKTCSIFGFKGEKKKFDFDIKVRLSIIDEISSFIYIVFISIYFLIMFE